MGSNTILIADENFRHVDVKHAGEVIPTHGFSSFKVCWLVFWRSLETFYRSTVCGFCGLAVSHSTLMRLPWSIYVLFCGGGRYDWTYSEVIIGEIPLPVIILVARSISEARFLCLAIGCTLAIFSNNAISSRLFMQQLGWAVTAGPLTPPPPPPISSVVPYYTLGVKSSSLARMTK